MSTFKLVTKTRSTRVKDLDPGTVFYATGFWPAYLRVKDGVITLPSGRHDEDQTSHGWQKSNSVFDHEFVEYIIGQFAGVFPRKEDRQS